MNPAQKIKATTQEHLNIEAIEDNLVILKSGACCLVLQTTAINFGLLSEKEQEATIYAYAGFLNSLSFPIQILINSRQTDLSTYLDLIDQHLLKQTNEKIKNQIKKYRRFITQTVKKNKVLDKSFFIIIPFSSLTLKKMPRKNLLEKAKIDLYPKRDHLLEQLQKLGLQASQLKNKELVSLFFQIYHPETQGLKLAPVKQYSAPFVQPAIKNQPAKQDPLKAEPAQQPSQSSNLQKTTGLPQQEPVKKTDQSPTADQQPAITQAVEKTKSTETSKKQQGVPAGGGPTTSQPPSPNDPTVDQTAPVSKQKKEELVKEGSEVKVFNPPPTERLKKGPIKPNSMIPQNQPKDKDLPKGQALQTKIDNIVQKVSQGKKTQEVEATTSPSQAKS